MGSSHNVLLSQIINGGHLEIQDGGQTKQVTTLMPAYLESSVSQTWVLPPFLTYCVAYKPSYKAKYDLKWRPFCFFDLSVKTSKLSLVNNIIEFSTLKLF